MTASPQRRAIVTGGAGFLGSHLVDRLLADRWHVMVIDDLSTGDQRNVAPEARLERLDVAIDPVDSLFQSWRPRAVFHLAAQPSVPRSMSDPLRDLAVNVIGTHRVAEASRLAAVDRLVFVSSGGAIYGETRRSADEGYRVAPGSFYGVHKLAAEGHVALSRVAYAIVRPSNIYGPRQMAGLDGAVIVAFLHQAVASGELRIDGDGRQTRDFVHVTDAVDALCRIEQSDDTSMIWNIATGRSISIAHLATIVERAVGHPLRRVSGSARAGDVRRSAMSAPRLRGLGWQPQIALPRGIGELLETTAST
jgi:UDP-glucose 4-epimerase